MASAAKRATNFKRAEIVRLAELVSECTVRTTAGLTYEPGFNDETVAEEATSTFGRRIEAADVVRFRKTSGLALATEGRNTRELLEALARSNDAMVAKLAAASKQLDSLARRVEDLEDQVTGGKPRSTQTPASQPRHGNGYVHPRPSASHNGTQR